MPDMTAPPPNVADLTLQVLIDIRADIREMKDTQREMKNELHEVKDSLHATNEAVRTTNTRLDRLTMVLTIAGSHHTALESRVTRIEQHLKLG